MIEKITLKGKTYRFRDWVTLTIFGLEIVSCASIFIGFLFFMSLFTK